MVEPGERDPDIARLLAALEAALDVAAPEGTTACPAIATVLGRCRARVGKPATGPGRAAPATAFLAGALALPRVQSRRPVAEAFAALAPRLRWKPKGRAEDDQAPANTMLLGPDGVEERDDVWIGATVMAPGVAYPVHRHPPEEVYLPLTPGEWWNTDMDWRDPGEGVIHNPPGIHHAMRAGANPLLAIWLLPL